VYKGQEKWKKPVEEQLIAVVLRIILPTGQWMLETTHNTKV